MASARRIRAEIGDIFRIPLGSDLNVYGQVVAKAGHEHLVVVFQLAPPDFSPSVLHGGIRLAGIVLDAKFRNGDWPIVTRLAPIPFRQPWFTLGDPELDGVSIEAFDSSIQRQATGDGARRWGTRHVVTPMVLQWAVQASEGLRPWLEDFNHLRRLALEMESTARDTR